MLKIVIVDDEPGARESLANFLNIYCSEVKILAKCATIKEAKEAIQTLSPDLVLLDIRLKKGTGFDLLSSLDLIDFHLIFTTAYDEYAIKAFKFNAIDYLLKPIDVEELEIAINKVKRLNKTSSDDITKLLDQIKHFDRDDPSITISTEQSYEFIPISKIIRLEASGSYTNIISKAGKTVLSSKILKDFEALLNEYKFFRVHHSHIINVAEMERFIKSEGGIIVMKNGDQVPVSRRKKEAFLERFVK